MEVTLKQTEIKTKAFEFLLLFKKFLFIVILFHLFSNSSFAQYTAEWANAGSGLGNNKGKKITIDPQGNIFVLGGFAAGSNPIDFGHGVVLENNSDNHYLIKYNSAGVTQWAKVVPEDLTIIFGTEGDFFGTGNYNGINIEIPTLNVDGNSEDRYLIKYNTNGDAQWAKLLAASSIATSSTGDLYVTGSINNVGLDFGNSVLFGNQGGFDGYLVKFNSDGVAQWVRTTGGTEDDYSDHISISSSGNIFVAGRFYSESIGITGIPDVEHTASGATPNEDIFVVKYDSEGTAIWANTLNHVLSYESSEHVIYLNLDDNENVYLYGYSELDFHFLYKYDNTGNIQWLKGFSNFSDDIPMTVDANGNIYFAESNEFPMDFGNNISVNVSDYSRTVLVKFNSDGIAQWASEIATIPSAGTPETIFNSAIALEVDNQGKIIVAGIFYGSELDFGNAIIVDGDDPNAYSYLVDCYLVQYNSDGEAEWAQSIFGNFEDELYGLDLDETGNFYITGGTRYANLPPGNFDFGNGISIELNVEYELFVAKFQNNSAVYNKYPLGIGFQVENDNSDHIITALNKSENNGLFQKGLAMYDQGDKIKYSFNIPESGNYQLKVRLRSGDKISATNFWPNGYEFKVNNSVEIFSGDESSTVHYPNQWGDSWFGLMNSEPLYLEAGNQEITIEAKAFWVILDYLEVVPATSSSRIASDFEEEKIVLFPNPVNAVTESFNIETEKDIVRVTIFSTNGEQTILDNKSLEIFATSAKVILPKPGLYFAKIVTSDGKSHTKQFLVK